MDIPLDDQQARIAAVSAALAILIFAVPALRSVRSRLAARGIDRLARALRARLPDTFTVLTGYAPRDDGKARVGLVVIGPPGVVVIEARDDQGELLCYQDHWYARARGGSRPIKDSPSKRARWNATRVRSDIATGGFMRTPVDALVVFTRGRLGDCGSSSVAVCEGIDGAIDHLTNGARTAAASPERTRALTRALLGPRLSAA